MLGSSIRNLMLLDTLPQIDNGTAPSIHHARFPIEDGDNRILISRIWHLLVPLLVFLGPIPSGREGWEQTWRVRA